MHITEGSGLAAESDDKISLVASMCEDHHQSEFRAQTDPTVRSSSISDSFVTVRNSRELHVEPRMNRIKSSDAAGSSKL